MIWSVARLGRRPFANAANVAFAKVIRATIVVPDDRAAEHHHEAQHERKRAGGSVTVEGAVVAAAAEVATPREIERARVLPGSTLQSAADCTKVLDELDADGPTLVMVPKAHLATLLGGTRPAAAAEAEQPQLRGTRAPAVGALPAGGATATADTDTAAGALAMTTTGGGDTALATLAADAPTTPFGALMRRRFAGLNDTRLLTDLPDYAAGAPTGQYGDAETGCAPGGRDGRLLAACNAGDAEAARALLLDAAAAGDADGDGDGDRNGDAGVAAQLPPHGGTPLHLAARGGGGGDEAAGLRVARVLLDEFGADPNARAFNGSTPLHWAAGAGHANAVALLLARGADPHARTFTWERSVFGKGSGQTAASWAAESGHETAIRPILERAPEVVVLDDERGATPRTLAEGSNSIDQETRQGMNALLRSVEEEEYVCVRLEVADMAHTAMPAPLSHCGVVID